MTIFFFAVKRSFRNLTNVVLVFALPLLVIFLPSDAWYALPVGFQIYGTFLLIAASKLVSIMMEDRTTGILTRIGVAPVSHLQYLFQNLLAYSLLLIIQCAVVIICGIIYGHDLVNPLLLFVVYSIFVLTAIGFSLCWYSLFRHKETALSILFGLIMLLSMAGGMFWPVQIMPDFMQRVVMFLPTYWLVEAMRVVTEGDTVTALSIPLAMLLLFTVAFLLVGSRRRIA